MLAKFVPEVITPENLIICAAKVMPYMKLRIIHATMTKIDDLRSVSAPEWVIWLVKNHHTKLSRVQCHPQHFGNILVLFSLGEREMRIIRDRGEVWVEGRTSSSMTWLPPQQWKSCPLEIAQANIDEVASWAIANLDNAVIA